MLTPSSFTMESVRQFMVANGGRVNNHDLVRHFCQFLTDPLQKDAARVQFKEYVNTLATIRVEDGEKVLILKRQYRPDSGDQYVPGSPALNTAPSSPSIVAAADAAAAAAPLRTPPPYRPPPQPRPVATKHPSHHHHSHHHHQQQQQPLTPLTVSGTPPYSQPLRPQKAMAPLAPPAAPIPAPRSLEPYRGSNWSVQHMVSGANLARPVAELATADGRAMMRTPSTTVDRVGPVGAPGPASWSASVCSGMQSPNASRELHQPGLPPPPLQPVPVPFQAAPTHSGRPPATRTEMPPPPAPRSHHHHQQHQQQHHHQQQRQQHLDQPVPPVRRHKSLDERRLSCSESRGLELDVDGSRAGGDATTTTTTAVSVREHAKLFNRIASETQLLKQQLPSAAAAADPGRSRFSAQMRSLSVGSMVSSVEDDDSISTTTNEGFSWEWCVASASSHYFDIVKLLKVNPRLAGVRDIVTGYTALHWAARHGNLDVIKLLVGTHSVDVHCRTLGGYTALHIAFLFDHEDAANLLVHTYGANPNMRDYSGKKPRHYQQSENTVWSSRDIHKKNKRKNSERDSGFLRFGSLNVRVKKTTSAINSLISGPVSTDRQSMPPPQSTDVVGSSSQTTSTGSLLGAAAAGLTSSARRSVRKHKMRRNQNHCETLKSRISAPILMTKAAAAAVMPFGSGAAQSQLLSQMNSASLKDLSKSHQQLAVRHSCGSFPADFLASTASSLAGTGRQTTPSHSHQTTPTNSCQSTPTYSRHSTTPSQSTSSLAQNTDEDQNSDAEYGFDRHWIVD